MIFVTSLVQFTLEEILVLLQPGACHLNQAGFGDNYCLDSFNQRGIAIHPCQKRVVSFFKNTFHKVSTCQTHTRGADHFGLVKAFFLKKEAKLETLHVGVFLESEHINLINSQLKMSM